MKTLVILATSVLLSWTAIGQTTEHPFIKGTIDIKYNSRNTSPPQKGVKDVYTLNVNVANSALFRGTVTDQPQIIDGFISKSVTQPKVLTFNIDCDVVNPKNPSQTKNVGRLHGNVKVDSDGSYRYDNGSVVVDILPMGNAGGFSSKFGGITVGKPLGRPANWMENLKRETVNITRTVKGKTTTVALKKYDKMEFRQHVIGAGPVHFYQAVTVVGELFYDYDKSCWFLNNLTMQYVENTTVKIDRISGTIRWDDKNAEYVFDVRVNEPPPSPNAMFEASSTDESAFFETDTTIPALVGTMKYKDAKRGDITLSSSVAIDLVGNNLSKHQTMALCKLLILSSIVPMNSD